jgi:hypothetical protein
MYQSLQQVHLTNDFHKRVRKPYLQRLSRFYRFRQAYSICQNKLQSRNNYYYKNLLNIRHQSIFTDIDIQKIVAELNNGGVSFDLQLPNSMVAEIYNFARITPCSEPGFNDLFWADDVKDGRLPKYDRYVMRGLVNNISNCQAIEKITHEPQILEIVHQYLKYWPRLITQHLTWSFASDLPESEIKKRYPPTNFHYDIAGYNFMTLYFYITDVDVTSGPHIMIKDTHKQKPLHMLIASNCQTDEAMRNYYGEEQQIVITGKKGFGFVQDPSCFHKLKPPVTSNRLLLQIRYS